VSDLFEWVIVITAVLLGVTFLATIEYSKQLRKAKLEYEKAKSLVEDIVLSFNRELRRTSEKLEIAGYKIEGNAGKIESTLKRVGEVEKKIVPLENRVIDMPKYDRPLSIMLADISAKVSVLDETQAKLREQVATLVGQVDKLSVLPEIKNDQVIPIKRDKAIATLTDTEMAVLETLSKEGPKTAPEIKERVKLSREHTARVMKKLYEEGYVERETGKIPFRYSLKKEMEQLLKKPDASQS
jgi:chromosome segregation ATPase